MRAMAMLQVPPPPAPELKIPGWLLVVLPLLAVAGLYAVGLSIPFMVGIFALYVVMVAIQFIYPGFFKEALRWVFLLFVLPFGIVLLLTIHWSLPLLTFPVYLIVVFSQSPKIGAALVGLLLFGLVIGNVAGVTVASSFSPDSPVGQALQKQREAGLLVWEGIKGAPDIVSDLVSVEIARATGTYYEGKVDQNAQKILGVQVGEPQVQDTVAGIPLRVFTPVSAEPLDEQITVRFSCAVDGAAPASYIPSSAQVSFGASGTQEVGCSYDAGALSQGAKVLQFNASYSFRTLGYIVGSFAFNDRLQQLRRQEVNLATEYGIVENPVAIHTNGPVKIGMGLGGTNPLPVYEDLADRVFVIGATIDRASGWATDGRISRIGDFFFIVPKEVTVNEVDVKNAPVVFQVASCSALPADEQQGCDDANVNVYSVDMSAVRMQDQLAFPISVRAISVVDRAGYESFLGAGGLSQHLFRVSFDYDFTISKQKSFTVRAAPTSQGAQP